VRFAVCLDMSSNSAEQHSHQRRLQRARVTPKDVIQKWYPAIQPGRSSAARCGPPAAIACALLCAWTCTLTVLSSCRARSSGSARRRRRQPRHTKVSTTRYTTRPLVCRTLQAAHRRRVRFAVCLDMSSNSAEQALHQRRLQRARVTPKDVIQKWYPAIQHGRSSPARCRPLTDVACALLCAWTCPLTVLSRRRASGTMAAVWVLAQSPRHRSREYSCPGD
jgi:hypothetical protein